MNAMPVFFPVGSPFTHTIVLFEGRPEFLVTPSAGKLPLLVKGTSVKKITTHALELRRALADICRLGEGFLGVEETYRKAALGRVAKAGRTLFRALVPDAADRCWLRNELAAGTAKIQLIAEAASVPWEAIYLAEELKGGVKVDQFLGYRAELMRQTIVNGAFPNRQGEERLADGKIGIGIVEDDELDSVRHNVARELNVARSAMAITELPLCELADDDEYVDKVYDFMSTTDYPKQMIHFDCHLDIGTQSDAAEIEGTSLRLSKKVLFDYHDFANIELTNAPFVFFNVCYGGTPNPFTVGGYATKLYQRGANCVVTSETMIGDGFAAMFAGAVYAGTSRGDTVSRALFNARRWVLDFHGNPSALFYTMYSHEDRTLPLESVPESVRDNFLRTCTLTQAARDSKMPEVPPTC
jgi:CHAT domain